MSTVNLFLESLFMRGARHGTEDADLLDAHVLTSNYVSELVLSFVKETKSMIQTLVWPEQRVRKVYETKGVIRSHKSKKDRQYKGQK